MRNKDLNKYIEKVIKILLTNQGQTNLTNLFDSFNLGPQSQLFVLQTLVDRGYVRPENISTYDGKTEVNENTTLTLTHFGRLYAFECGLLEEEY